MSDYIEPSWQDFLEIQPDPPEDAPPGGYPEEGLSAATQTALEFEAEEQTQVEEDEKEWNRKVRVAQCGRPIVTVREGQPFCYPRWCENHRECANCMKRRADETQAWVRKAGHRYGGLFKSEGFTNSENIQEIKALRKPNYLLLPQDGDKMVAYTHESIPGSVWIEMPELLKEDFMVLACTPEKRRITGSLGKNATAPGGKSESYDEFGFFTDAPLPVKKASFLIAVQRTAYLRPTTDAEAAEADNERCRVWRDILEKEWHFFTQSYIRKMKIKCNPETWVRNTLYLLRGGAQVIETLRGWDV